MLIVQLTFDSIGGHRMALVGYPALCEGALGLVGKLFAAGATDGIRSLSGYLLRFVPQE